MDEFRATRLGVIGGGPRGSFFLRQADRLRDHLETVAVTSRSAATRAKLADTFGVPTVPSLSDLIDAKPDFVLVAVRRDGVLPIVLALHDAGIPTLVETPPAVDVDGLRQLWATAGSSDLVQVAEQSMFMPSHAAKWRSVDAGVIGTPTSVQVSSNHGYHAVAMIRAFLGGGFGAVAVNAIEFRSPVVNPVIYDQWQVDPLEQTGTETIATLDFGGALGLYDFTEMQWFSPIRHRRLVVRGSLGEIDGESLIRLKDGAAVPSRFLRRQTGIDMNHEGFDLDTISLDGSVLYRNPYLGSRMSDEDLAASSLLDAMSAWVRDRGAAPYPLADGCQDQLIALAIEESAAAGRPVQTAVEPWAVSE